VHYPHHIRDLTKFGFIDAPFPASALASPESPPPAA
jgi:hypothetical protein